MPHNGDITDWQTLIWRKSVWFSTNFNSFIYQLDFRTKDFANKGNAILTVQLWINVEINLFSFELFEFYSSGLKFF